MFERHSIHFLGENPFKYWSSYCFRIKIVKNPVVSHIQKFRDASSSLRRDTVSPAIDELDFRERYDASRNPNFEICDTAVLHINQQVLQDGIGFAQIQKFD